MTQNNLELMDMSEKPIQPRRFVDRTIPIGLVITLLIQIAAGIWYASAQAQTTHLNSSRLDKVEEQMAQIQPILAVLKDRSDENNQVMHDIASYIRDNPKHH